MDVVVAQSPSIFKLFTRKDKALLIRGYAFLILDFGLDIVDGIAGLDLEGDGLASEGLDKTIGWESESLRG